MSKNLFLPLSLVLAALALTGCPGEEPKCPEGDADCVTPPVPDAGEETDAGTDAGETLPCNGACSGATPVCDPSTDTCVSCTASAGCTGDEVCDTSVAGGQCVVCNETIACGADEVCDSSVSGGNCVTCTATDGCGESLVCDTQAAGGEGACVSCTATAGCGMDETCDISFGGGTGRCVVCTASIGCGMDEVCDPGAADGKGECVTCTTTAGCGMDELCDTAANGGAGACVTCTATAGCGVSEVCDTTANSGAGECVTCTETAGCTSPQFCDTTANSGAGQCVTCSANAGCGATQVCDTAANSGAGQCVGCTLGAGCPANQTCDVVAQTCYTCKTPADCTGNANGAICDTGVPGGRCVECTNSTECATSTTYCDMDLGRCAPTPNSTSVQIANVRAASGALTTGLPIDYAIVTYVKPATGNEVGAFFLQAEQPGPAIPVELPSGTTAPLVGDRISLTVTNVATLSGGVKVVRTFINPYSNVASGGNVGLMVQDVSNTSDLVASVVDYEAEAVKAFGGISGTGTVSGTGFLAYPIQTMGYPTGNANLLLRVPATLADQFDLVNACAFYLDHGVMWRFNAITQVSAFRRADFKSLTCPAPAVTRAFAFSPTTVEVRFDRNLEPSSVNADGSQFTISGLTVTGASVSGRNVLLTTSAQTSGTSYTVTAAQTFVDTLGRTVDTTGNTGTFLGYRTPAELRFNEVNPAISSANRDLIELIVTAPGTTEAITIWQDVTQTSPLVTLPDIAVQRGDLIMIHFSPDSTNSAAETTAKDQHPKATFASNYDTAWDVPAGTIHITFSSQVLRIRAPNGDTQDGVAFAGSSAPAGFTTALQQLQADGHWSPADCGGAPCSTASTPTQAAISVTWTGSGTSAAGVTSKRTNTVNMTDPGNPFPEPTDTNQKSDWTTAPTTQSWGAAN